MNNSVAIQEKVFSRKEAAAELKYGSVSVTAKVHNGRVVEVNYSTTESTRETENIKSNDKG